MKKLFSLVAVGAVLLAACGGGGGNTVAATVNGTDVTVADVNALIDAEGGTVPGRHKREGRRGHCKPRASQA